MRIALVSDVHANLPALQAAMARIKRHAPDLILSLGDQVNLGPCPRETLALLEGEGARCLRGNHERYVLSAMRGDPAYAGANFASLRFNAARLTEREIAFPEELRLEGVTFCHAMPGDDRFPVNDPEKALPLLARLQPERPLHVVCGHGHNPLRYRLPNLTVDVIGSAGCMDDGAPGTTTYTILQIERGAVVLRPFTIPYDTRPLRAMFRQSGMAEACPVMARLALCQMRENRDYLVPFVTRALRLSRSRGEESVSLAAWREADARFDWPDGLTTGAFWRADA